MNDNRIAEILERCEAATMGPWKWDMQTGNNPRPCATCPQDKTWKCDHRKCKRFRAWFAVEWREVCKRIKGE